MAVSQQKFREIVFQLLYSCDFTGEEDEEMVDFMMREFTVPKRVIKEAQAIGSQLRQKKEELDQLIAKQSSAYKLERIPRVERNILRLGIFEMLYMPSIPPKVSIAEAIRLSRKFATPEGATFVNAILDGIYQTHIKKIDSEGA